MERYLKRSHSGIGDSSGEKDGSESGRATPQSLTHPISPPQKKARLNKPANPIDGLSVADSSPETRLYRSPFQLTWVRDLPAEANVDALTLKDLLGDPLISDCWEFNYLHDIDFLLSAFDDDTRHLVNVHVIHGFWKQEDTNRIALETQASRHDNVTLHTAYMPEMFGTHHSKMLILLRHDDTAEVVIHTANMILRDWTNMTQAVWRSPRLPVLSSSVGHSQEAMLPGSGEKFKVDLLNYLRAYNSRRNVCRSLVESLDKYDFSTVRGSLIGSVPGRHSIDDDSETRWGWAGLKQALRSVPVQDSKSEIVVQISSIATMGGTDTWLRRTLFESLSASKNPVQDKPTFRVVFPTPDEIRRSLDGYDSGASIHTKIQSNQQAKQLQYLKPIFCHWANDAPNGKDIGNRVIQDGGRKRAAPHIKTYIRYGEQSIDWALTTSANLSKQAWGEAANSGEIRVASWEIGVLVWPSLIAKDAKMIATFRKDLPDAKSTEGDTPVVGLRIPYNLPLQPYSDNELPWVATATYNEPDWRGQRW